MIHEDKFYNLMLLTIKIFDNFILPIEDLFKFLNDTWI